MTVQSQPRRPDSGLRKVLRFAAGHWARRKGHAALLCAAMSLATLTEIFVPVFAGQLIDALALGQAGYTAGRAAFLAIVALGFTMVALRHVAWRAVVPFTLSIMREACRDGMSGEAFEATVQLLVGSKTYRGCGAFLGD